MSEFSDVLIIGGGASGMMAAVAAAMASRELRVTVLEKAPRVGRKLLATGNGRCNFSNANVNLAAYHGENPEFINGAMSRLGFYETIDLFEKMGVVPRYEEYKMYPNSGQAASVLDALRFYCARLNVDTVTDTAALKIERKGDSFTVFTDSERYAARRVIVACGGKASGRLGGCEDGYILLRALGHTCTKLFPAIVQVRTETAPVRPLKGIKTEAYAEAVVDGRAVRGEYGEVLFTDYGLSGPPIMQLSRIISTVDSEDKYIRLDLMPDYEAENLTNMLISRANSLTHLTLEDFLTGMLNKRLGQQILKQAGLVPLSRRVIDLTDNELVYLSSVIKSWDIKAVGVQGFDSAQVTAGGIRTDEFDSETLESKRCRGVYACGEVLDIDGDCGGFNLQWAWSSGYTAGSSAAASLGVREEKC